MKTQEKGTDAKGIQPNREQVNDFLRKQVLCVVSTLDETGAPMGATVAFSVTKAGELLIGTGESTHKSRNIDRDARVAITVTDSDERITVQIQGTARKLTSQDFDDRYAVEHYRQRPESLPFKDEPGQAHILITPHRIRFSDTKPYPWVVTEFNE